MPSAFAECRLPADHTIILTDIQKIMFHDVYLVALHAVRNKFRGYRDWLVKSGYDYDQIDQIALYHTMKAVKEFDPSLGFKLSTFVTAFVLNAMRNAGRDLFVRMKRESKVYRYQALNNQELSTCLAEDPPDRDPSTTIALNRALLELDERERDAVRSFFGFGKDREKLHETAVRLGCCKERVRQIRDEGLKKLKKLISKEVYFEEQ